MTQETSETIAKATQALRDMGSVDMSITARTLYNRLDAGHRFDRRRIADYLLHIGAMRGALVEQRDEPAVKGFGGASIRLNFSSNGVGAMLGLDNLHGGKYALISWYNTQYPARLFTTRFCVCAGALPVGRPHHKATTHPSDWYSLAIFLDGGLLLAARGEAFTS